MNQLFTLNVVTFFLLWQKTNFLSYSWDVGGCNSKLSLINPIQPSRDHLLLVQCRIPRLCIWVTWICIDEALQEAGIAYMGHPQPLYSGSHSSHHCTSLTFPAPVSFAAVTPWLALPFTTAQLASFSISFFLPCPRSSLRLLFHPLFFLCSSYAQPQPWSQPLGLGLEQEQVFKAL